MDFEKIDKVTMNWSTDPEVKLTPEQALEWLKLQYAPNYNLRGREIHWTINKVIDVMIPALEKQIPKKPLPVRDVRSGRIISFTCPNCNHTDLGNNEFRFEHCEECGQALDWSENNATQ